MKKTLRLTYDLETVTTGFSLSADCWHGVMMGALALARALEKRSLKATFFLSLSRKTSAVPVADFEFMLDALVSSLRGFGNIQLQPHIHAFDLPVGFPCKSDFFSDYSEVQQMELLAYAKRFFSNHGLTATVFRPGGYRLTDQYYRVLAKSGFTTSSVLDASLPPHIDLVDRKINVVDHEFNRNGIREIPVTAVRINSIKHKVETINLSPDFFALETIRAQMEQLQSLTINAHSFSMFIPRLMRETHKGQTTSNMKFMLFERPFNRFLVKRGIYPMYKDTMAGKENIRWLDYFAAENYDTEWLV